MSIKNVCRDVCFFRCNILLFFVTYSVSDVCLTFVECSFLFLFRCPFSVIVDYYKYLRTASDFNPTHFGKWPFYMDLIHVEFSVKYMHWWQYWMRSELELMNWTIYVFCWVFVCFWWNIVCFYFCVFYFPFLFVVVNMHYFVDSSFTTSSTTWLLCYILHLLSLKII